MSEESFIQHDVENKQFEKNKIFKEEPKEIKSPNWFDKNKFKEILAIIDSNKFNYKNKIGEFKYIDIKDLVNNIRNNTISEISAKKGLNTLNKIKNAEIIKYKRHPSKQKELFNLFNDLLDAILTDKTLKSKSQKDNTLMSSKDENENEKENDNGNENENEKDKTLIIKQLNDSSKSFEEQIESIRKVEHLEYLFMDDYVNKELKFKIFKVELAHLSNIIEKKIFKQIYGHTLETLANKLINTTNREENQIIVNNINEKKNFTKKMKQVFLYDFVIQPNDRRISLIEAIDLILDFNETMSEWFQLVKTVKNF